MRRTLSLLFVACLLSGSPGLAGERYEFRTSDAYRKLSKADRERLEQVHRDFMTLWGALDRYADDHDGSPPDTLEQLTPLYLRELPVDPFAPVEASQESDQAAKRAADKGRQYRYRRGAPGNRAWCLCSVGLPGFPYLSENGNVDLYVCKGYWVSGINMKTDVF
mgnify:CR=1 FL=1